MITAEEYIKSLKENSLLADKLSKREYTIESGGKEPLYPSHLAPFEIHEGIKNGRLHQGAFLASRDNFLEAQVNVEGFEKSVSLFCGLISQLLLKYNYKLNPI